MAKPAEMDSEVDVDTEAAPRRQRVKSAIEVKHHIGADDQVEESEPSKFRKMSNFLKYLNTPFEKRYTAGAFLKRAWTGEAQEETAGRAGRVAERVAFAAFAFLALTSGGVGVVPLLLLLPAKLGAGLVGAGVQATINVAEGVTSFLDRQLTMSQKRHAEEDKKKADEAAKQKRNALLDSQKAEGPVGTTNAVERERDVGTSNAKLSTASIKGAFDSTAADSRGKTVETPTVERKASPLMNYATPGKK